MAAALIALLLAAPQDDLEKRVGALVEQLRSEEIERREKATKELVALGEPASPFLEKAAAAAPDPESAARLKGILERIRRQALIAKVNPPARPVSISARDLPLRDFLRDVCAQAGVEFSCEGAAGDRTVTIEARGEPLLQVVDRACASRGNVVATIADGRLRVASGAFAAVPTAYVEGFRIRLRKSVITEVSEGGAPKTSVALYFDLDAQPDQKVRGVAMSLPRGTAAGGEIALRGLQDAGRPGGVMFGGGGPGLGVMIVDGLPVAYDPNDSMDRICLIKEAPPGLKRLESLTVAARFRFAVGKKPVTVPLSLRGYTKVPDIPYTAWLNAKQFYFMAADQSRMGGPLLEEFVDVDSITLVAADGTEAKAVPGAGSTLPGRQYMFQLERAFQAADAPQLQVRIIDLFEREVEFEMKDVKLRD